MQLHMYEFTNSVSLLGSSHDTYVKKSSGTNPVKLQFNKTAQICIRKLKYHGCISEYVFILLLHLLTLSGRFRVGFGVGDTSNFIELNL